MHKFLFFNRKILRHSESRISAVSSASLYGRGVFTTAAIKNKKPFLWEKHWRRLSENAVVAGIDLSEYSEEFLTFALDDLIKKNDFENGRARITFFDESASRIWNFETESNTSLLITTADLNDISDNLKLTISSFPVNSASPLAGIKSCNYLENILALEEAKRRGFDEAVRFNEKNEIVSASTANIFWIKNGEIFTPALETGCLPGTTRALIIENFPVRQVFGRIDELIETDEIFLTSSTLGIRPAVLEDNFYREFSMTMKLKKFLHL